MKDKAVWYVYQLCDLKGNPFYIGKGKGNRIDFHEKEAEKGVCSKKCQMIRELIKSHGRIAKNKIAMFWDEQAAYDYETELIEDIGLINLTNVLPGGQKAWERRVVELRERKKKDPTPEQIIKQRPWFTALVYNGYGLKSSHEVANMILEAAVPFIKSAIDKLSETDSGRDIVLDVVSKYRVSGGKIWQLG